ncbi:oxidoreductase-like domain-containing protein [Hydrogenophaga sp.]|uniref:oxidoreductase-like domain-containing protein n=1 Tax=Hydrogenophaga sp. TaxID=1904254 RepID=UPI0026134592|nr:oxidoreductase-like domain-containing protein [Hydrogenophaga sp.]
MVAHLRGLARRQGQDLDTALRPPPPEPQTCCGRGCNGCVWEGYYAALGFWREDALAAMPALPLRTAPAVPAAPAA